ncbi:transporter substrate-binding domain-containing protein [Legionella shakespearei]|uniref:Glutamine ABC transporter n=1 Tax=Legionella shakespearei DSM 23087 TaxID=1122169 RepID=A0A0W0Z065_9GAMM|nr:transporter substrate-binding domain-containing protein [Legionella shakespearei]KTD62503.1 glutamine ABC transporter [Legionella shakespearei DSM 23087]
MKRFVFIILFLCNFLVHGSPVIVGVVPYAPPFSSKSGSGDNYFGFAIDLMSQICKRINMECVYKAAPVNSQLSLLNQGTVDVVFTPQPITVLSNNDYLFSLPYLASDGQFLTLDANKSINSAQDVTGKRIGVLKNTLYDSLLRTNHASDSTITQYGAFEDMMTGLVNKDVDVIIMNYSVAHYLINNNVNSFRLVGNKIPVGEGYGILALQKNAALIKQINSALLSLEEDGTYLEIYKQYFGNQI